MGLFRDPEPKTKEQVKSEKIFGSIKKYTNPPKKKVKYTWKGLGNLLMTLDTSGTGLLHKKQRIEQLKEGAPETEKDYIDFFEDLELGLYGIAENTYY